MSKEACRDLGIIDEEFPAVGSCGSGASGSRRKRSSSAPPPLINSKELGTLGGSDFNPGEPSCVPVTVSNLDSPLMDDVFGAVTGVGASTSTYWGDGTPNLKEERRLQRGRRPGLTAWGGRRPSAAAW